jgi:hypothetical protein
VAGVVGGVVTAVSFQPMGKKEGSGAGDEYRGGEPAGGGEVIAADEQRTDELPDRERSGHSGDETGGPGGDLRGGSHGGQGGDHEGGTHGHRRHRDCGQARPRHRRQHAGGHQTQPKTAGSGTRSRAAAGRNVAGRM